MYKIINRLPQPINLITKDGTIILDKYGTITVSEITTQMKNLNKKWFIRICKVKIKK